MTSRIVAAFLICLSLAGSASAQYPNTGNYRYGGRARLSPYLNLIRDGDPAANYYLGVVPERERRFNDTLFNSRIRSVERRTEELESPSSPTEVEEIPLPQAGRRIGSRPSASYFKNDSAAARAGRPRGLRP